jgi:AsmA-like C-terminal region
MIQGHFPLVRMSANDDIHVDLERIGQIVKIQMRASQMDLRPYLKQEFSTASNSAGSQSDFDLDLKAINLLGYSNQSMQQAELKISNRNGEIKDFKLSAKFDQQLVSGQIGKGDTGQNALLIESTNAGDFLRFMDLYHRMEGGRILLQITPSGESRSGVIIVNDFILKDDPALNGVAQIKYPSLQKPLDTGSVNFTKLRAQFILGAGRFTLSDAVMWGPSIGGTLDGTIDYTADITDLTGVFVPLYGINNMLTQIPVLGPFLLGGTSGGIFGINFRVTGSVNNPNVSINPLSAVAPGIFRKLFLFGVGKPFGETQEKAVPPGSIKSP